jgi:hypothetical protein
MQTAFGNILEGIAKSSVPFEPAESPFAVAVERDPRGSGKSRAQSANTGRTASMTAYV